MTVGMPEPGAYRSSRRVQWETFLPWMAGTFAFSLLLAGGMSWLFQRGWFLIIVVPVFAGALMAILVSVTVDKGKCRFPELAGLFWITGWSDAIWGIFLFWRHFFVRKRSAALSSPSSPLLHVALTYRYPP